MDLSVAIIAVSALVALTAAATFALKRSPERTRVVTDEHAIDLSALGLARGGELATIVQFSTEMCARCPGVRRVITELATPGIEFVHVDVTHRPEIAGAFRLLKTPTVLILDPAGRTRARLTGAISRGTLARELSALAGGLSVTR